MGEINCNFCHRIHGESVFFCNRCHFFDIEVP
ncbi:MAG: hypothetical protein DRP87_01595 [Spirochaetes bacterium]|nr:MAG: hypothetical protein DRP87_01595 [Spirochaetota bacterium]